MIRRIALISEHASPIAPPGSVDSGGQNVYVAQVARHLARRGLRVDVFTRRDDARLSEVEQLAGGVRVVHIKAGPEHYVPKEDLLDYMDVFADRMLDTAPFVSYGEYMEGYLTRLSTAALLNVTAGGGSTVPSFLVEKR